MLSIARALVLTVCTMSMVSCSRPAYSKLIGEWTNSAVDPTARVTYRADHTYFARMEHPRDGAFRGEGTWRLERSHMICRDSQDGESRAEILELTEGALRIRGPYGIISTHQRVK
jgi:hypothetical protein